MTTETRHALRALTTSSDVFEALDEIAAMNADPVLVDFDEIDDAPTTRHAFSYAAEVA